ncbi:unnamed protein product, partial [Ectocarpus sp. 13 AM-2016]
MINAAKKRTLNSYHMCRGLQFICVAPGLVRQRASTGARRMHAVCCVSARQEEEHNQRTLRGVRRPSPDAFPATGMAAATAYSRAKDGLAKFAVGTGLKAEGNSSTVK